MTSSKLPWTTITEPRAVRTCTLAGIERAKAKSLRLTKLAAGLEVTLRDIDSAREDADFWAAFMVGARLSKATCDAFVHMAAAASGSGGWVKDSYDSITSAIDGDWAGAVKSGADVLPMFKWGFANATTAAAVKHVVIKGEIVHSAMNQDKDGVLAGAAELRSELAKYSLDFVEKGQREEFLKLAKGAIDHHDKLGESYKKAEAAMKRLDAIQRVQKGVRVASAVKSMWDAGYKYSNALDRAGQQYIADRENAAATQMALKTSTRRQLEGLQKKIRALEEWVAGCAEPEDFSQAFTPGQPNVSPPLG